jgi:hypothetical protein
LFRFPYQDVGKRDLASQIDWGRLAQGLIDLASVFLTAERLIWDAIRYGIAD